MYTDQNIISILNYILLISSSNAQPFRRLFPQNNKANPPDKTLPETSEDTDIISSSRTERFDGFLFRNFRILPYFISGGGSHTLAPIECLRPPPQNPPLERLRLRHVSSMFQEFQEFTRNGVTPAANSVPLIP